MDLFNFQIVAPGYTVGISDEALASFFNDIYKDIKMQILLKLDEEDPLYKLFSEIASAYENVSIALSDKNYFFIVSSLKYLYETLLVSNYLYGDSNKLAERLTKIKNAELKSEQDYLRAIDKIIESVDAKDSFLVALKAYCNHRKKRVFSKQGEGKQIDNKSLSKGVYGDNTGVVLYDFFYKPINIYAHPKKSLSSEKNGEDRLSYIIEMFFAVTDLYDKFLVKASSAKL